MSRLREWFAKKNQQWKYERIVKHIKNNNSCPRCGEIAPDVAKIYKSVIDEGIWIAAMNCTRSGCNTHWTAPQALNGMM